MKDSTNIIEYVRVIFFKYFFENMFSVRSRTDIDSKNILTF